jgi:hypothetical protein
VLKNLFFAGILKVNDENSRIRDPLVRGMDPRIRIHTKMSWIWNTGFKEFWTKAMGPFLHWLVRWACPTGTRDFCAALVALVGAVQKIFSLTVQYFNCPHRPESTQAVMLGRLSLSICLWVRS